MASWTIAGDAMTEDRVIACAVTDEMAELSALTVPKMRAYAERCAARFVLFDGMPERFQDPKYRMFEAGELKADRVLLLDADIVVRDSAPDIFEAHPTGCWMFDEGTIRRPGWGNRYRDRIMAEVAQCPGMPTLDRNWGPEWWNPGVALLDGGILSELYVMPPWDVTASEHLWDSPMEKDNAPPTHIRIKRIVKNMPWLNWRIRMLGLALRPLHIRWNTLINGKTRIPAAYFWHCTGSENDENRPARKMHMIRTICRNNRERLPGDTASRCSTATPAPLAHVHFIYANLTPSWILGRMQKHIMGAAPNGVRVTTSASVVDQPNTINYYNPYRHWKGKSRRALDVVFCTHPEREKTFYASARAADAVVVMCNQYLAGIIGMGVPADRVHVIHPGVEDRYRDARLRVFSPSRLDYTCARKGADVWKGISREPWLDCVTSNGKLDEAELLAEYQRCDVVVSTATLEGGPMAVIEGLSLGKPIVARAGVGWVDEFPEVLKYRTEEQLVEVLRDLHAAKQRRAESVARYTWEACAAAHWDLFRALAPQIGYATRGPVSVTKRQRRREQAMAISTWTVAGTIPPGVLLECIAHMRRFGWEYTDRPTAGLIVDAGRLESPSTYVRNRALKRIIDEAAQAARR